MDLWRYCKTQWRAGLGGLVGLDYPAVFAVAEVLGVPKTPSLLQSLEIMEQLALDQAAKDAAEAHKRANRAQSNLAARARRKKH